MQGGRNDALLCNVIDAIRNGNTTFLSKHIPFIKNAYEKGHVQTTTYPESRSIYDILIAQCHPSASVDGLITDKQSKRLLSIKFLIDNGAVNPNFTHDQKKNDDYVVMSIYSQKTILLAGCITMCSWLWEIERAEYVLLRTSDEVLRNFRDEHGNTIAHILFQNYTSTKVIDMVMERLVRAKFDFTVKSNDGQILLYYVSSRIMPKYVKFFLSVKQNPNDMVSYKHQRMCNVLQELLYEYRHMKSEDHIQDIASVFKMLLEAGMDFSGVDADKRNIMDYVDRYCWFDTSVWRVLEPWIEKNDLKKTGNEPSKDQMDTYDVKNADPASQSPVQRLLFLNRYEKNPAKIEKILDQIKEMKVDLYHCDSKGNRLYDSYIANGYWRNTSVDKYFIKTFNC